jgi:hypothetical protein
MADTKIKDLTAYTTPLAADVIPLHKSSDDTDKKVTVGNLFNNAPNLTIPSSTWDGGHIIMGAYHLWIDATGDLRIKSGAPANDTDGTVVGTQS